jgi:hypothetical protein
VDLVEAACARVIVPRSAVGADGLVSDSRACELIAGALGTLVEHCRRRAAERRVA